MHGPGSHREPGQPALAWLDQHLSALPWTRAQGWVRWEHSWASSAPSSASASLEVTWLCSQLHSSGHPLPPSHMQSTRYLRRPLPRAWGYQPSFAQCGPPAPQVWSLGTFHFSAISFGNEFPVKAPSWRRDPDRKQECSVNQPSCPLAGPCCTSHGTVA